MGAGPSQLRLVRGVVAVITRGVRLLLIRRADGIDAGGAWCLPGGAIQTGETPEQALVREIREELGVTVRPAQRLWTWRRADQALEIEWWRAEIIDGRITPDPSEVAQAAWMTLDTIRRTPGILPNNLEFLAYAERCGLLRSPSPDDPAVNEA